MNNDRIAGQWKQLQGKLQAKWGDLTDDDVTVAKGDTKYLVGRLQERYGMALDEAEQEVNDFAHNLPPQDLPSQERARGFSRHR